LPMLAYDRVPTERPRHFIVIGTTNSDTYLRDGTGNRRFWPVKITGFDLEALAKDRDQLWAEAVVIEASGAAIRLDRDLWPAAGEQQEQRRVIDPWEEVIALGVGETRGRIRSSVIWGHVGLSDPSHRTQEQNSRLGLVMKRLGFSRRATARSAGATCAGYCIVGETGHRHTQGRGRMRR
jgi:hypothetical protein